MFKSDILDDDVEKPKKKLKKAADSDDQDLLNPKVDEDEDNDIIHSDEGLTPNEDNESNKKDEPLEGKGSASGNIVNDDSDGEDYF